MTLMHVAAAALIAMQSGAATKPPAPAAPKPQAGAAKPAATRPAATDLAVTVTYKGKGAVDASHRLIAWLFTEPAVTANSRPVATLSTAKNGDVLTFENAPATPVYLFVALDRQGGYDGRSGPPPAGSPTALYSVKGAPAPVKAGDAVKVTLDDSRPWK
jgi:hypothetical protein